MMIRCCQCDSAVTPDLLELVQFDAVALCLRCADENDRRHKEGDPNLIEVTPEPLPPAVDLDGKAVYALNTGPEGFEHLKKDVDRFRLNMLREFDQQLP